LPPKCGSREGHYTEAKSDQRGAISRQQRQKQKLAYGIALNGLIAAVGFADG
jgi:hypothetical protein